MEQIIVLLIIAAAVVAVVWRVWRMARNRDGMCCGKTGGCSGCITSVRKACESGKTHPEDSASDTQADHKDG